MLLFLTFCKKMQKQFPERLGRARNKLSAHLVCLCLMLFVLACKQSPSILLTEKPAAPTPGRIDWTIYNNTNSALPRTWINCITFDVNENIVWAGLYHKGLARFDGAEWQIFTKTNSGLPSDSVLSLTVDPGNNLWVGTVSGLAKCDGAAWTTFNTQNSP